MTTGLHGAINAEVTGESINELYTLNSSSVVTTNNLSATTGSDGLRQESGTNGSINLFNTYTDGGLRDSNFENNHAAQAPIKPIPTTGNPTNYVSHNSSILLGNVIKGKTSNIYCRTLRNGKELDF